MTRLQFLLSLLALVPGVGWLLFRKPTRVVRVYHVHELQLDLIVEMSHRTNSKPFAGCAVGTMLCEVVVWKRWAVGVDACFYTVEVTWKRRFGGWSISSSVLYGQVDPDILDQCGELVSEVRV